MRKLLLGLTLLISMASAEISVNGKFNYFRIEGTYDETTSFSLGFDFFDGVGPSAQFVGGCMAVVSNTNLGEITNNYSKPACIIKNGVITFLNGSGRKFSLDTNTEALYKAYGKDFRPNTEADYDKLLDITETRMGRDQEIVNTRLSNEMILLRKNKSDGALSFNCLNMSKQVIHKGTDILFSCTTTERNYDFIVKAQTNELANAIKKHIYAGVPHKVVCSPNANNFIFLNLAKELGKQYSLISAEEALIFLGLGSKLGQDMEKKRYKIECGL